jgi:hypothetical protein
MPAPVIARFPSFGGFLLGSIVGLLEGCAYPQLPPPVEEGRTCSDSALRRCAEGLACVPDVGADYGFNADADVCERPRAAYRFLHFGERGENNRVDEALDMIDGVYRLPRMLDSDPNLATVPHPMQLVGGQRIRCRGNARRDHDCEVPDWKGYFGDEVSIYNQFVLFGLRMTSSLFYVYEHASDSRLISRFRAHRNKKPSPAALFQLRRDARSLALAVLDSFVRNAQFPYALATAPACGGATGYQNPNVSWAPDLSQWDPALTVGGAGQVVQASAADTPVACDGSVPWSYRALKTSLWEPHATAYRAIVFSDAYQQLRGLLSPETKTAWLTSIRQMGEALALPSGYEPGNNHGITESMALIQLGHDFKGVDAEVMPERLTDAWVALGRHRLNDLLMDTVFPDGVQVEQSPFYHDYQLNLLLEATDWLDREGINLTDGVDARYAQNADAIPPEQRFDYDSGHPELADPDVRDLNPSATLDTAALLDGMVRAAIHVGQPDGWIPLIGSSLPQRLSGYAGPAFSSYLERGGAHSEQLRFYRSLGAEGLPPADEDRLQVFENSGFVTMHSGFSTDFARETHVVFNAGMPFHKHSHADALSVHLFGMDTAPGATAGVPLLIDPGWYSYVAPGRHYFESTLAHNTVSVDGMNQCLHDPTGKRASPYADSPLAACEKLVKPTTGRVDFSGDGSMRLGRSTRGQLGDQSWLYQSAQHGLYAAVRHRRAVLLLGRDVLVVLDDVSGSAPHVYSQTWHLSPNVPSLSAETAALAAAGPGAHHLYFPRSADDPTALFSLHEASAPSAELALHYGDAGVGEVPGQGWYSTAENEIEPSGVVEFVQAGQERATFASVFLLGARAGQFADLVLTASGPGSVNLAFDLEGVRTTVAVTGLGSGTAAETVSVQ